LTDRLRRAWRAGPRGLPSLPLAASLVAVASLSAYSIIPVVEAVVSGYYAFDWENFVEAAARLNEGTLYEIEYPYAFRWSPVAAWLLGFITLMPLWAWQALHVAVLPLLRSWWLVAACLVTYPFWFDIQTGNIMIFVTVAGFWALRGSPLATALFLGLTVLVPRPLMLPLAIWILWSRPAWRLPFGLFLIGHAVVVAAGGHLGPWIGSLLTVAPELTSDFNYGPSRFIGVLWVPIGVLLAAWLMRRRRLGLAGLAISPYWLPYYFLMLIMEAVKPNPAPRPEAARPLRGGASRADSPGDTG
jgi:hypothetical protein